MSHERKVNPNLLYRLKSELFDGEELLWAGQPIPGRGQSGNLTMTSVSAVFIGVVLGGGMFAFMRYTGGMTFFIMPMILILLVALGMIGARLWNQFANRQVYAVTDQRLLIVNGRRVRSYGPNDIQFIERHQRGDGWGDIVFAQEANQRMVPVGNGMMVPQNYAAPIGFFGVPNVREVEGLILDTFRLKESKRKHGLAHTVDDGELIDYDLGEVAYYEDAKPRQTQS